MSGGEGELNVALDAIKANLRANVRHSARRAAPKSLTGVAYLIAGGPSAATHLKQLQDASRFHFTVAVNGSYQWCVDNGITPDAMVMVDARPENARFLDRIVPNCRYFLASQCHPSVFERVPTAQLTMWHNAVNPEIVGEIRRLYGPGAMLVHGGPTVTTRALWLLDSLGVDHVELYGMDGDLGPDAKGYSYNQNVEGDVWAITVRGKQFRTTGWLLAQMQDFFTMMRHLPNLQVVVCGNSLMSHVIMNTTHAPNNVAAIEYP